MTVNYDFCQIPGIPGWYTISRGMEFVGNAYKRRGGKWNFEPAGKEALLQQFKTKLEIAKYAEATRPN